MTHDTCPNGHPATDRMTDGMPVPCTTQSCTYYRRPVAQVERVASEQSALANTEPIGELAPPHPSNTEQPLDDMITEVRHGRMSNTKAKAIIATHTAEAVRLARIDELSHVQLEYGGRFVATTYADGDGQTITARMADLKSQLKNGGNTND